MRVSKGLSENFATYLYGKDKAGPWVTKTDIQTLNEHIKPIIYDGLQVQGLENLNAYLLEMKWLLYRIILLLDCHIVHDTLVAII